MRSIAVFVSPILEFLFNFLKFKKKYASGHVRGTERDYIIFVLLTGMHADTLI